MRKRRSISLYRPIRPRVGLPEITPAGVAGRLLWLDASSGVNARGAVSLDGSSQYLSGSPVAASYPFSVAIWCRPTAGDRVLWGQFATDTTAWTGHYLYLDGGLAPYAGTANNNSFGDAIAPAGLAAGAWNLVVGVWEGPTSRRIYLNGGNAAANTTDRTPAAMHHTVLGASARGGGGADSHFAGDLDNGGVWGRALSAAEVAQLYDGGAGLSYAGLPAELQSGLLSWWDLDEPSGTRRDTHGTNHLAPQNGPTAADGLVPGPADDLDPVSTWVDRVAAMAFAQATVARRPAFRQAGGLDFDGIDDLLDLGATGGLVGDRPAFTLLARVRPDAPPTTGPAVLWTEADAAGSVANRLAIAPGGNLVATYRPAGGTPGSATSTGILSPGVDAVVAVRRDGTTLQVFLGGAPSGPAASIAAGTSLAGATTRLGGPVESAGFRHFDGRISAVFAVDRALSDAEIAGLSAQL